MKSSTARPIPKKTIAMALSLASLTGAFAAEKGGQEGHGGNAIVCFSDSQTVKSILAQPEWRRTIPNSAIGKITSIKALDLYEAEKLAAGLDDLNEEKSELVSPKKDEKNTEYLNRIARRFEKAIPVIAEQIRDGIAKATSHTTVYGNDGEGSGIAQVYDLGDLPYVVDRTRCLISTVARQTGTKVDGKFALSVDGRLMNHPKHSEFSRKIIMLHEMIYAWGIVRGHTDSAPTRTITAKLIQKNINRADVARTLVAQGFTNIGNPDSSYYFYGEWSYFGEIQARLQDLVKPVRADLGGQDGFRQWYHSISGKTIAEFENQTRDLDAAQELLKEAQAKLPDATGSDRRTLQRQIKEASASIKSDEALLAQLKPDYDRFKDTQKKATADLKAGKAQLKDWIRTTLVPKLDTLANGKCYATEDDSEKLMVALTNKMDDLVTYNGIWVEFPAEDHPSSSGNIYSTRIDLGADFPYCQNFQIPVLN